MVIKASKFKMLKYYYNIFDKFGGIVIACIMIPISIFLFFIYFYGAFNVPDLKKYVGKPSLVRCIEFSSYSSVYYQIDDELRVNAKINHVNCEQAKEFHTNGKNFEIWHDGIGTIFGLYVDNVELMSTDEKLEEHVVTVYGILVVAIIWLILSLRIIRNNKKYIAAKRRERYTKKD